MINIKKKDAIYSYFGYFIKIFSNIIILPIILNKVSSAEFGMWSIFLSIGAFATLFDMGFGDVITRYSTYACCGAKKIPLCGTPEINGNKKDINYQLLFEILLTANKIYKKIGLIALSILMVFTIYILYIANDSMDVKYILSAWFFYVVGISVNMYFLYYSSFFKGLGKIKELQEINIINQLFYILLKIVLVSFGLGLLGLGIANFLASLLIRLQLARHINNIIKMNKSTFIKTKQLIKENRATNVYKSIKYNSKKTGYILISNYIQGQGSTLLCSAFLSLEQTAMYGLTIQLIGVLSSLAAIPFSTFLPQLSSYRISKESEKLKNLYSILTIGITSIYFIGALFVIFFGETALKMVGSNTNLLPMQYVLLLLFYQFVLINHQRSTNFISVGNEQPYVKGYVVSSFISLLLDLIAFIMGFGLMGFILVNLLIQLIYNAWKWPKEAFKITGLNIKEMFVRSYFVIYKVVRKRQ